MGFTVPCAAEQHDIALLAEAPPLARSRISVSLIGVSSKVNSSISRARSSLTAVIWYLTERAFFSLISAASRSPTI
jgi:hypothetical protein